MADGIDKLLGSNHSNIMFRCHSVLSFGSINPWFEVWLAGRSFNYFGRGDYQRSYIWKLVLQRQAVQEAKRSRLPQKREHPEKGINYQHECV